ncbi:hypothetical protein F2P79_011148 [Pimephales promelas]|nr:hypothetical protein F2P79_011148 [Pimephales promelas]
MDERALCQLNPEKVLGRQGSSGDLSIATFMCVHVSGRWSLPYVGLDGVRGSSRFPGRASPIIPSIHAPFEHLRRTRTYSGRGGKPTGLPTDSSARLSHYLGVGRSRETEGDGITESTREKSNGRRGKPLHNAFESEARERGSQREQRKERETERSSEGGRETLRLGELTPLPSPLLSSFPPLLTPSGAGV